MVFRKLSLFIIFLACSASWASAQSILSELCAQDSITIGVRDDAPPFSLRIAEDPPSASDESATSQNSGDEKSDESTQPEICGAPDGDLLEHHAGYTIALCRDYLHTLLLRCSKVPGSKLKKNGITVKTISVKDRYLQMLSETPPFDMLCGATTSTVSLRAMIPTSPYTFLTSTSALVHPRLKQEEAKRCRIGVVAATTSDASTDALVENARRIDTLDRFLASHPLCDTPFKTRNMRGFQTLEDALKALTDPNLDNQIDVVIGDHHILLWYRQHFEPWKQQESCAEAVAGGAGDDCGGEELPSLVPATLSIEPYAVIGPPGGIGPVLVADFSRQLTLAQGDANGSYTRLLRSCFQRQVDRSFWSIMDFQSKVRDSDLLPGRSVGRENADEVVTDTVEN